MEMVVSGGPVSWLLFMASVVTVGVIIDKAIFYHRMKGDSNHDLKIAAQSIRSARLHKGIQHLVRKRNMSAYAMRYCLEMIDQGVHEREAITNGLQIELRPWVKSMSSRLRLLALVYYLAPLLGILGTVLGIMKSIHSISMIARAIASPVFTAGISEALITTAFGIALAIVAKVGYEVFLSQMERSIEETEYAVNKLLQSMP